MTRIVLLSLAAAVATPAFADTPIQFERDGIRYVASIKQQAGVQHIVGRELISGRTFDLRVAKGRVSGDYAGSRVSYVTPGDVVAAN